MAVTSTSSERTLLWILTACIVASSIGIGSFLLPIMLFAQPLVIPVSFLLGLCVGLLMTYSLLSLRIERKHHLRAYIFLACSALIITLLSVYTAERRVEIFSGSSNTAFAVGLPFVAGIILPYALEGRLHGSA
jgi:hypothetical protein